MANAIDVAKYILETRGSMSAMKLQKLVYYSQAWSLVWNEESLFPEEIQAWANGPVVSDLYTIHRREYMLTPEIFARGNLDNLIGLQRTSIDTVLDFYGDKTAQWLSDLTHMEDPWSHTRSEAGLEDGARGTPVITNASMAEYYSSLSA